MGADLSEISLYNADFRNADMRRVNARGTAFDYAKLDSANLANAKLGASEARESSFMGARLNGANLHGADMREADLRNADLKEVDLTDTDLRGACLFNADLRGARMSADTDLRHAKLNAWTRLLDIVWNNAPVFRLNWGDVDMLGDERVAREHKNGDGKPKNESIRLLEYGNAALANQQIAVMLRGQGLHEHADRFAYRSHCLTRQVLIRQRKIGRWLWSWFLESLAGYGYEPIRTVFAYLSVVLGFSALYINLSPVSHLHLSYMAAFVMSVASFHGRGFFPAPPLPLDSPVVIAVAFEAILGLVIEASFVATFVQRFFAR